MGRIKKAIHENDLIKVLKIRSFLFLMISEFFTQVAFNMQHFVLIFIIYDLTGSNTAVSGIILSFTIPAILFSLISGVYVDRWNKKKVLLITNLLRGLLILPFLISNLHLGLIYTFTFFIAVATQFFLPAESAILLHIVPKKLIVSANAVFALGIYSALFLGYILSGPAVLLLGKSNTILLLGSLFFISTIFTAFIKLNYGVEKVDKKNIDVSASVSYEVKEIFSFIRRAKKVTHALIILTLSQAVIFMFAVLGPGYMTKILGIEVEGLSWILLAPAALGMMIGGIILGSFGKKFNNRLLSTLGFTLSGVVFILLPLGNKVSSAGFIQGLNSYLPHLVNITILHIVVVLAFIAGFANSLIFIPSNATLQIETSEKMRGRIYGFLNALIGAVSLLPVALAGGLADLFGVASVITVSGVILLVIGFGFLLFD